MFRLYLCKYLFLGGWATENNWHLHAKNLKRVKGAEFQGAESEMCGLASGCNWHFELHSSFFPGNRCRGPLTLLEGSEGAIKSWVLEKIFPHVLFFSTVLTSSSGWLKEKGKKKQMVQHFLSGEWKQNLYAVGHQIMTEFSVPTGFQMPQPLHIAVYYRDWLWPIWGRGCAVGRQWVGEEVLF
jgi:hypothetical protein